MKRRSTAIWEAIKPTIAPLWRCAVVAMSMMVIHPVAGVAQCPPDDRATASLTGVIRTTGERPVGGASVLVTWDTGSIESESDDSGSYLVCGVPVATAISIVAATDWAIGQPLEISLPRAERYELLDFVLPEADPGSVPTDGSSGVRGIVVDATTGEPVGGVRVRDTRSGRETASGEDGAFRLERLAAGRLELEIEHIAYGRQRAPITLEPGASTVLRLALEPQAIGVEPLHVTVEGTRLHSLETRGFYERQRWGELTGLGSFFEREYIERRMPQRISHLVGDVPGVWLDCAGSPLRGCQIRMRRSSRFCPRANVYLDGVHVVSSEKRRESIDEFVLPSEVVAVEVYTGAAQFPAEYGGSAAQCGAVVIWTR